MKSSRAWSQKVFLVVSELILTDEPPPFPRGDFLPVLHKIMRSEQDAKDAKEQAEKLPEDLRVGLRIITGTLRFEMDSESEAVKTEG